LAHCRSLYWPGFSAVLLAIANHLGVAWLKHTAQQMPGLGAREQQQHQKGQEPQRLPISIAAVVHHLSAHTTALNDMKLKK